MRAANSCGVAAHVLRTGAAPPGRSRSASSGSARTRTSASASAAAIARLDEQAGLAVVDEVGDPADAAADDAAAAAERLDDDAAHPLGARGKDEHASPRRARRATSAVGSASAPLDPLRRRARGSEPEPTTCSRASGTRSRTARPRSASTSTPCSARARRRRARSACSGSGTGGPQERLEIHVGRELGVGLAAGGARRARLV